LPRAGRLARIAWSPRPLPKEKSVRTPLLLAAVLLLTGAAKEDKVNKELKKFEGTWVMVSGEKEGKKIAAKHVKRSKITWKGTKVAVFTPHQSKETIRGEITLDPDRTPRQMDWVRSAGPHKGETMRGIYEFIADDQYRICFALPGKERPARFTTTPGSGHTLHVWKRARKR
jgi:uncharacterized protein (TIGR03067 family)